MHIRYYLFIIIIHSYSHLSAYCRVAESSVDGQATADMITKYTKPLGPIFPSRPTQLTPSQTSSVGYTYCPSPTFTWVSSWCLAALAPDFHLPAELARRLVRAREVPHCCPAPLTPKGLRLFRSLYEYDL